MLGPVIALSLAYFSCHTSYCAFYATNHENNEQLLMLLSCSQLPSNLFLRRLGAVHYLAFLVISWGAVQLAMGFVPSWEYLAACRTLLGVFEVGFSIYSEVLGFKPCT